MLFEYKAVVRKFKAILIFWLVVVFAGCQNESSYPLKQTTPRWWKGNLHMHSVWSDGRAYPEMAVDLYKRLGYHFVGLSDHNRLPQGNRWMDLVNKETDERIFGWYLDQYGEAWVQTRQAEGKAEVMRKPLNEFRHLFDEPGRFMIIPSEEITMKQAHLNGINLVSTIPPEKELPTAVEAAQYALDAVQQQSADTGQTMLCFANHPNYKWQLNAEEMMSLEKLKFFEVYNGNRDCYNWGDELHPGTERMWDIILTKRLAELNLPILYGLASDDTHHYFDRGGDYPQPHYGRGWIMVRSAYLTPESIINAMNAGDFYAGTGVMLTDLQFDGKTLTVKVKPEFGVSYTIRFIGTRKGYDPSSEAVVVLDKDGNEMKITRKYSDDIGQVFKEVRHTTASYTMTDQDIYVRAYIQSTKKKSNWNIEGECEAAWTQPVEFGAAGN